MKYFLFFYLFFFTLVANASSQNADLVIIEKSKRLLTLKKHGKEIKKYSVALGASPVGPKRCQGDNKTPEGTYKIIGRNSKSSFYKSLHVSYPSKIDIENAKKIGCSTGGDIMIHGLPNGKGWIGTAHTKFDWTAGCVAVTDSEIDEIWNLVAIGTTVQIVP